ncbi:ABC transporter ATP-binding protein [Clostridium chromiireducens]|uniref:ABC transporter ATP-binding protein n=1 Tax=Clostridium chromiireducens TaxID=225345 RepID=A0A1V4IXR8_9CLOT|nr:ABC transporter ATP-binding protein [Clostridium chromiireducens]MVX64774.1 ATP-binding cassette domain-containing protein [Clostridium chromiireducens]OPJ64746.1 high-affinity branched-chain amino acid transport ATP-binding protein LivF [Clostridium chromiireducens]RII35952.1 ABC transporter ATP-binding protein [Clostridium chromiireducens]
MLKVKNINVFYGAIHAIHDLSLEVNDGEIVTLIGANGAGKTSTLRAISGLNIIKSGEITYDNKIISNLGAHKIVAQGISQVPEGRRVFGDQTVEENLLLGAYLVKNKAEIKESMEKVFNWFPRVKERRKQFAGTLSGGEQQMLAIGRALMGNPKLLLLDEPSMGLAPIVVEEIFEIIKNIRKDGTTILLVEQNANAALQIADRGYVVETGSVVLNGPADKLLHDDSVRKAYLGE